MPDVPLNSAFNATAPEGEPQQAFCIDADRVYDSCGDKDCLSEMRVFFTEYNQEVINRATSVRIREANIIDTVVKVEPVTYHRGFYSIDLTFYFEIVLDVNDNAGCVPNTINGLSVFCKRVILYGGEGNVAVFSSDGDGCVCPDSLNLPIAKVQVAKPVPLTACLAECCNPCMPANPIPECVIDYFGSCIVPAQNNAVLATIGVFSIVQLKRSAQMLIPAYDFCIPDKECVTSNDNPCDMFSKVDFPVEQFFPPNLAETDLENGESTCKKED